MNATFFGLKRAYWGTLRRGRDKLNSLRLTAARFDLLYALTDEGDPRPGAMYQSSLRKILGVTRPTVSVMLRSLEKLGMVSRTPSQVDRRQIDIALTPYGRSVIVRAYRDIVASGWSQELLDWGLNGRDMDYLVPGVIERCLAKMDRCDAILDRFRRVYADFATLRYFWSPILE